MSTRRHKHGLDEKGGLSVEVLPSQTEPVTTTGLLNLVIDRITSTNFYKHSLKMFEGRDSNQD